MLLRRTTTRRPVSTRLRGEASTASSESLDDEDDDEHDEDDEEGRLMGDILSRSGQTQE